MYYIDVIIPLALDRLFAYRINQSESQYLQPGMRVAVPFGKSKLYTAIVHRVHQDPPLNYDVKDIELIIDDRPTVTTDQLQFWQWIASYYVSSLGQVMRCALPKSLLLESETIVVLNPDNKIEIDLLDDQQYLIIEALQQHDTIKVSDVMVLLDRKSVLPILNTMIDQGWILLQEELYNIYRPKTVKYINLHSDFLPEESLKRLLDDLARAHKQRQTVMTLFMLQMGGKSVTSKQLQDRAQVSRAIIKKLIDNNILIEEERQVERVLEQPTTGKQLLDLNPSQDLALSEINTYFDQNKTVLLHGVTSSGKTEIYVRLIKEQLDQGNQVLYLLPEIALTTQLISRLKTYFKHQVLVYHSRYTIHERLEVWNHIINDSQPYVVIGARSALLLPFRELQLIIIDEEHESSYKQFDPDPRYHARDAAVMLGHLKQARVLLGSATPSIESYYNASIGKYGLVELTHRYGNVMLPDIQIIDLKDKLKRKKMTGHFSDVLIHEMQQAFDQNKQVILFQNRRGYAPILECNTCGEAPQCPNCDVSLTYHQFKKHLRCHYCGYHIYVPLECPSCSSTDLDTKGFGTQQIEEEFNKLFPDYNIARMDMDTTRGKNSIENIIEKIDTGAVQCLVGTQMISKGLDFRNISLVGVINADSMLNFPDFRAHERSFQLLTQVSGRAGRTHDRGKVLIQSYDPSHQIIQQVSNHNYNSMYTDQLEQRYQYHYPPYHRLIRLTFKHRDYNTSLQAAQWFVNAINQLDAGIQVLGPEFPPVSRIRNLYIVNALIKTGKNQHHQTVKNHLRKIKRSFESIKLFRSVRFNIDVDCY